MTQAGTGRRLPAGQVLTTTWPVLTYGDADLHADPWKEERYSDQETRAMQRMRAEAARRLRGR